MKKKKYIIPMTSVTHIDMECPMLAGSTDVQPEGTGSKNPSGTINGTVVTPTQTPPGVGAKGQDTWDTWEE